MEHQEIMSKAEKYNNFMKLDRHQLKEKSKKNKMKQREKSTLRSLRKRKAKDHYEKAGR